MKNFIVIFLLSIVIAACDSGDFQDGTEFIINPSEFVLITGCGTSEEFITLTAIANGRSAGEVAYFADLSWSGNSGFGTVLTELYVDNGSSRGIFDVNDTLVSGAGMALHAGSTNSVGKAYFIARFNTCDAYTGQLTISSQLGATVQIMNFGINAEIDPEDDGDGS